MFSNVSRSRLLPMSLPFRFFGAAVAFQVAAWALLLAFAKEVMSFEAGLGPVFASLHLLTLGVLAMSAIGATLQLLPVATRQPVRVLWAVRLLWWVLVPGIVVFVAGSDVDSASLRTDAREGVYARRRSDGRLPSLAIDPDERARAEERPGSTAAHVRQRAVPGDDRIHCPGGGAYGSRRHVGNNRHRHPAGLQGRRIEGDGKQ